MDDQRRREVADQIVKARKIIRDPGEVDVKRWAIPDDAHLLRAPAAFRDDVVALFSDDTCKGDTMPAAKTHDRLQFREHECSVWFGYHESYKSIYLNELITHWACRGIRCAVASFEMPATKLIALSVRQALALAKPDVDRIDFALEHLSEALTIYDVMGKVKPAHLLAVIRYCAVELGCRHFVIDNLTTLLPVGNDHSDLHKDFFSGCQTISRVTGMHVHCVAHTAKPDKGDETKMPTGYNIRGIGSVPDLAENLICVFRNKAKEDKIDADKADDDVRREPDLIVKVDKQKHWDFRGRFNYWIDRRSLRFNPGGMMDADPMI
jgi:hypothetical protein